MLYSLWGTIPEKRPCLQAGSHILPQDGSRVSFQNVLLGGVGGLAPLIPNCGTRWNVSGQLYALAALLLWKEPSVPIEQDAGWNIEEIWTLSKIISSPPLPPFIEPVLSIARQNFPAIFRVIFGISRFLSRVWFIYSPVSRRTPDDVLRNPGLEALPWKM